MSFELKTGYFFRSDEDGKHTTIPLEVQELLKRKYGVNTVTISSGEVSIISEYVGKS